MIIYIYLKDLISFVTLSTLKALNIRTDLNALKADSLNNNNSLRIIL